MPNNININPDILNPYIDPPWDDVVIPPPPLPRTGRIWINGAELDVVYESPVHAHLGVEEVMQMALHCHRD